MSLTTPNTSKMVVLTHGNWNAWQNYIEARCGIAGVWDCVTPGWTKPPIATQTAPTTAERTEQRELTKAQGIAKGLIK